MTLRLPRLPGKVAITDKPASITFARFWDQACTAIENVTPGALISSNDVPIIGYMEITLSDGTKAKVPVIA